MAAHNSFGEWIPTRMKIWNCSKPAFYAEVERVNKRVAELASGRRFKVTQNHAGLNRRFYVRRRRRVRLHSQITS